SLTMLHRSGLELNHRVAKRARFLAGLQRADVTVVTGDFLAEPEAVGAAVGGVAPTRGRLASWFVLGSNDYFVPRRLNYLAYFRKRRKRRVAVQGRGHHLAEDRKSVV